MSRVIILVPFEQVLEPPGCGVMSCSSMVATREATTVACLLWGRTNLTGPFSRLMNWSCCVRKVGAPLWTMPCLGWRKSTWVFYVEAWAWSAFTIGTTWCVLWGSASLIRTVCSKTVGLYGGVYVRVSVYMLKVWFECIGEEPCYVWCGRGQQFDGWHCHWRGGWRWTVNIECVAWREWKGRIAGDVIYMSVWLFCYLLFV